MHDVSEGGLAVALAETAIHSGLGAALDLEDDPLTLFGEVGGQAVIAVPAGQVEVDPLGRDVELRRIGEVGGDTLFGVPVAVLRRTWESPD